MRYLLAFSRHLAHSTQISASYTIAMIFSNNSYKKECVSSEIFSRDYKKKDTISPFVFFLYSLF